MFMATVSLQQRFSRKGSIRGFARGSRRDERWAVILAGGDGTRLRPITRTIAGGDRPKQFCPILGGQTLVDLTRQRVALSIPPARTVFVVTEKHERFYQPLAMDVPKGLMLVQPDNKGTAPAILYPLLRVAARSRSAAVALFPSDHYFADDEAFMAHVDAALDAVGARSVTVTLLGITPRGPETEYGWIEPEKSILGSLPRSITRVRRFWEKPNANVARKLMERGCLWNSFVMVGCVDSLLTMIWHALPELYAAFTEITPTFETSDERSALRELYTGISAANFSRQVLATRPEDLTVMRVGEVGWSDLGEPARVLKTLTRLGVQTQLARSAS
jgi:mannose-1-phosphate guanylyltransferase